MRQAFFNQRLLNNIGKTTPSIMWFNWYTTMITINKLGKRVYAETTKYNERAKVHFAWDAAHGGSINNYLFMVIDRFEYNIFNNIALGIQSFSGAKAFSINDMNIPINTKIQTICSDIKTWFQSLSNLSDFQINDTMMANGLINTIQKYNFEYCASGIDSDFSRQNNDSGRHWVGYLRQLLIPLAKDTIVTPANDWRFNTFVMQALYGTTGQTYFDSIATYPYTYPGGLTLDICPDILLQPIIDPVVLILAPCTLDTKGGPLANKDMKVAFSKGVYVAGNAGGNAFTASGYFGAGGTLGPALFEGWIAGKKAAYNNYESNEDNNFGKNLEVVSFMNNAYPDKTIALNFADPISFGFVNKDAPDNFRIAFKFSDSINDNITLYSRYI